MDSKWFVMDTIVYLRKADNGAGDSSNVDALQSTRESCVLHHLLFRKVNKIMASPMLIYRGEKIVEAVATQRVDDKYCPTVCPQLCDNGPRNVGDPRGDTICAP